MKYKEGKTYKKNGKMFKCVDKKMYPFDDGKLGKAAAKDDEEEYEETEEDEDMDEGTKKAEDLTEDDLQKSLDALDDLTKADDTVSRKDTLLEKAKTEELDKSEKAELLTLLGGSEPAADAGTTLGESVVKSIDDNEALSQALDVSEYLQEQHTELCKSLSTLGDAVEKSDVRQHEFNLVLAKAMHQTGQVIKAMSERMGVMEAQPARPPKTKGIPAAAPLTKSFAGDPAGSELSKGQIQSALGEMLRKSVDSGQAGATPNGEDLNAAASKYEQFATITPSLLAQVQEHLKGSPAP